MASALSYTLLGTLPDAELSAAADKDALTSADQVAAQTRRLLSLPRARTRASQFMVQWLGTATLGGQKSAELYPTFNDDVRNALRAEEKSFGEYILFDASNPSEELYRSKYVFANGTLAKHYGIDGVSSPVPQRVPAAGTNRRGVLTLGSVLASYAKADITAPVQRGAFVRKRLLCQDVPPPVPGASSQLPGLGGAIATTRQRFESHSTNPDCSGCHKLIDQVGFAFEKFDATGAFRLQEAGRPIDDSGLLANIRMGGTAKDVPLQGMESLADTLATSDAAPACFVSQVYRYTRGFKPGAADVCAERKLQQGIRAGNARDLLVNLLTQPSFRNRRTTGGSKP
jgi:hypothetical protein